MTEGAPSSYVGRTVRPRFAFIAVLASTLFAVRAPAADGGSAPGAGRSTPDDAARRAAIVAHVGPRTLSVGEVEDRLAAVPRFQLLTFGSTGPEVTRKFLDQIIVPDVLYSLGAEDQHLDQDPAVAHQIDRALSNATLRATRAQIGLASAIPMDEVKAYFDANRARYDTPERVNVWRILCATREEAQGVLDEAKKDGALPKFTQLARDHSIDKATYLRGGNLGFVSPDGASNEPGLVVDPAVVKASQSLKDGELAPAPIPEGPNFAVVWRRGSVKGVHRTLDDVAAQIRDTIWREKKDAADKALLDRLRAEKVSEVNESLLGTFDVKIDDGKIGPRRRPGVAPLGSIRGPVPPSPQP